MRPEDVTYYASLVTGAELAVFDESSHTPHLEEPERYLHRADSLALEGSA